MTARNVPDLTERYGNFKCELCGHCHDLDGCQHVVEGVVCGCVNEDVIEEAYERINDDETDAEDRL